MSVMPVRNNTALPLRAELRGRHRRRQLPPRRWREFFHTETPAHLQGRGIASQLVRGALDEARAKGLKVKPRCSFVGQYVARHPETHDLLA